MGLAWVTFNLQMLGASSEAGVSQRAATVSLLMAPLGKENLLGGVIFCSAGLLPGRLVRAGRLHRATLAIGAHARWVVLTWFGISTRCPDSHGKKQRVRQLVQEASALLGGACVFACVMAR